MTYADRTDQDRATITDVFLDTVGPRRQAKHRIDDEAYVAMLQRMIRALLIRAINNPAIITLIVALADDMRQMVNVVIAANAARCAVDPRKGISVGEAAKLLAISQPAASQRRTAGNRIMLERIEAAGITLHSEAQRERAIRERAAEEASAVLVDFNARRRSA